MIQFGAAAVASGLSAAQACVLSLVAYTGASQGESLAIDPAGLGAAAAALLLRAAFLVVILAAAGTTAGLRALGMA